MDVTDKGTTTLETTIKAPVENVWKAWTDPSLILKWYASKHDYLSGWKTTFTKLEQLLNSGMKK